MGLFLLRFEGYTWRVRRHLSIVVRIHPLVGAFLLCVLAAVGAATRGLYGAGALSRAGGLFLACFLWGIAVTTTGVVIATAPKTAPAGRARRFFLTLGEMGSATLSVLGVFFLVVAASTWMLWKEGDLLRARAILGMTFMWGMFLLTAGSAYFAAQNKNGPRLTWGMLLGAFIGGVPGRLLGGLGGDRSSKGGGGSSGGAGAGGDW